VPAIQLARLKKQLEELRAAWAQPELFERRLINLLEAYADHSLRTGQAAEPATLLPAYNVPRLLIRQIVLGLDDLLAADPAYTLTIAERLWQRGYFEPRLLAIHFLGYAWQENDRFAETSTGWMAETNDDSLVETLFTHGLSSFAAQKPLAYLDLAETWLQSDRAAQMAAGLRALETLIRQPAFDNIPRCFRIITPMVRQPSEALRPELSGVLKMLGRRSPAETAYFYLDLMKGSVSSQTATLIRYGLESLPQPYQTRVRDRLREKRRANG
jgi:hypothetical protein